MLTRTSWRYIEPQYALLWTYSTIHIARFCLKNIRLAVCITPSRPRVLKFPIYMAAQLCNILYETYIVLSKVWTIIVHTASDGEEVVIVYQGRGFSYSRGFWAIAYTVCR